MGSRFLCPSSEGGEDSLFVLFLLHQHLQIQRLGGRGRNWSWLREEIPWTSQAVRVILHNERYTGKLISLRTVRQELGNPNQRAVPNHGKLVLYVPVLE